MFKTMKSFRAVTFLLSGVIAYPSESGIQKRQELSSLVNNAFNVGYGKVPDVPGATARRQILTSRAPHVNATTVKIRYGPYKIPNASRKNVMGESGSLYNFADLPVEKPCGECILVGISADLEYPDGRQANTPDGFWLHHMVLMNEGPGRMDPPCVGKSSLPHLLLSTTPAKSERVFGGGNERTRALFTPPFAPEAKMGYFVNNEDNFQLIVDLMNMNDKDEVLYMTITYDYIDGRPAGFENMKAIWLDADSCGTSEIPPPQQSGKFTLSSTWTSNLEGEILGAGGHVHDGGTHLTLAVDGKVVCDSMATYGIATTDSTGMPAGMGGVPAAAGPKLAARTAQAPAHSHGGKVSEHIVAMSQCIGQDMGGVLKKGQKWELTAYYDFDKYPGMRRDTGQLENIMGLGLMYVKNPKL